MFGSDELRKVAQDNFALSGKDPSTIDYVCELLKDFPRAATVVGVSPKVITYRTVRTGLFGKKDEPDVMGWSVWKSHSVMNKKDYYVTTDGEGFYTEIPDRSFNETGVVIKKTMSVRSLAEFLVKEVTGPAVTASHFDGGDSSMHIRQSVKNRLMQALSVKT